jgi:hypothetical protein
MKSRKSKVLRKHSFPARYITDRVSGRSAQGQSDHAVYYYSLLERNCMQSSYGDFDQSMLNSKIWLRAVRDVAENSAALTIRRSMEKVHAIRDGPGRSLGTTLTILITHISLTPLVLYYISISPRHRGRSGNAAVSRLHFTLHLS